MPGETLARTWMRGEDDRDLARDLTQRTEESGST